MSSIATKLIGEAVDKPKSESRVYTITARPDHLDIIEELFAWINSTRGGHSGTAKIGIDGDGAARVEIEKKDGDLPKLEKDNKHFTNDYKIEFSVYLD